jgi:hypothetical protein
MRVSQHRLTGDAHGRLRNFLKLDGIEGESTTTSVRETLAKSPTGEALLEEVTLHFGKSDGNIVRSERRAQASRQSSAAGM